MLTALCLGVRPVMESQFQLKENVALSVRQVSRIYMFQEKDQV